MQSDRRQSLVAHLERHLGPISKGWILDPAGEKMPFSIALFEDTTFRDTAAFSTLGLSNYPLGRSRSGAPILMEIIVLLREGARLPVPDALLTIGKEAIQRGQPLLRGNVVGPRGPLWDSTELEAFYVTEPLYLPESFATVAVPGGDAIMIWLIPITRHEVAYVVDRGWPAFELLLRERNPDLLDPYRSSCPGTVKST